MPKAKKMVEPTADDFLPVKLTEEQLAEITKELVDEKLGTPVRFQFNGRTVCNLRTGQLHSKGINVIHQTVYWRFSKETANKIAGWLGAKAVFSE